MILAQGLSWDSHQDFGWACSGLGIHFQESWLTWPLAGSQSLSLAVGWRLQFFFRSSWVHYDMAAGFHENNWSKKEKGKNHNVFYNLSSEVTHYHLHNIPLAIQENPITAGRGWRSSGAILEAGYHRHSWLASCPAQCPAVVAVGSEAAAVLPSSHTPPAAQPPDPL